MTTPIGDDSLELGDYLAVLRRRWLTLLALTCVGALIAAIAIAVIPRSYTATSSVLVYPVPGLTGNAVGGTTGAVNMDNEAQVVRSQAIAVQATQRLGSTERPSQFEERLDVSVPPNTTVLGIGCSESSPGRAAACANTVAGAYLSVRQAVVVSSVQNQVAALRSTLAGFTRRRESATTRQLRTGIQNTLSSRIATLANFQAPGKALAGGIINTATASNAQGSRLWLLIGSSGLLAGLIAGLLAAFVVDQRKGRLYSARDVERLLGLPVLLSLHRDGTSARAFAELAHVVAARLGEMNGTGAAPVVVVAPVSTGDAARFVVSNLTASLSRTWHGVESWQQSVGGAADGERIAELRSAARCLVIEARPPGESGDAYVLSRVADATLVVIEAGRTSRREASGTVARMALLGTDIVGAVVVPPQVNGATANGTSHNADSTEEPQVTAASLPSR